MERLVCGKGLVEPLEVQSDGADADEEERELDSRLLALDIKRFLDNCAAKNGGPCNPANCPAAKLYETYAHGDDEDDDE